jgi:hypothetical protein
VIGSSLAILPSAVDEVNGNDEVDEDGDDEVDEDGDDEVDEDCPTGRARICCRPKPTGGQ